jgi:hypothetical protein
VKELSDKVSNNNNIISLALLSIMKIYFNWTRSYEDCFSLKTSIYMERIVWFMN